MAAPLSSQHDPEPGHSGPASRVPLWLRSLAALGRAVAVAVITGIPAGLLIGGLGSRGAMRVIGLATGSRCVGLVTENGNLCGIVTFQGSLELLLFAGVGSGVAGGLLCAALRPWLVVFRRWAGVVSGGILLLVFGSLILDARNPDFTRFATPGLNIALFAVLFVAFGVVWVPIQSRLAPFLTARLRSDGWTLADAGRGLLLAVGGALGAAFLIVLAVPLLRRAVGQPVDPASADALKVAFFYLAGVLPAIRLWAGLPPPLVRAVLLAPPLLLGLLITGSSVLAILRH